MKPLRLCAVFLSFFSGLGLAAEWHHPLYLGGGELWQKRIPVTITNEMDRDVAGLPVFVPVGRKKGEAPLEGVQAGKMRVCDTNGVEMLFDILDSKGISVHKGRLPRGSQLALPAECQAKAQQLLYVYFDNPKAWNVPDFLQASPGVRNGCLEEGSGDCPAGWQHDPQDNEHRAFWSLENPKSGSRCLKTVVSPGAEHTWIATRQRHIHIIGGAQYRMRAWVKAEGVEGFAGWYIHVGNEENSMIISPMLDAGDGSYGWKEVVSTFTAPDEANVADLGTVLRGTGKAWFDDVRLDCLTPSQLFATAGPPEHLNLKKDPEKAAWFDENLQDNLRWDVRTPVRVPHFSDTSAQKRLIYIDLTRLTARLKGRVNEASLRVVHGNETIPHFRVGDGLLLEASLKPHSLQTYYVYLSEDDKIKPVGSTSYEDLLLSAKNLVQNPSFESGGPLPDHWPGGTEGVRPQGTAMDLAEEGRFGLCCGKITVPHEMEAGWTGWRQDVPVERDKTYLYSAWLRCEDLRGSAQLHAHFRNEKGELCESRKHTGAGPPVHGTQDWTLVSGLFSMPEDIATFQLHLTMNSTGALYHDGVLLIEVTRGEMGGLEWRQKTSAPRLAVWPVNAVVKVFQGNVPPPTSNEAELCVARNEKEPLQLAIRSEEDFSEIQVQVMPPKKNHHALKDVEVALVGYVPIDHPTSYYRSDRPAWQRKFPTSEGQCDGWAGLWPDPLLPRNQFDLKANETQAFWITVSAPKDAASGDYQGYVLLKSQKERLAKIPFKVHVWDFELPDESHVKAIYDLRLHHPLWRDKEGSTEKLREKFWRFMADHRVSPHTIAPSPSLAYKDGQVVSDFSAFDRAASTYFNALKLPHAYMPWDFYCFGWGHPPGSKFGETPYEGEYPYEESDRSTLRPAFREAYQACLKVHWDHLKEKGWEDRCVLYISDEPYYDKPHIRKQMKALCEMIHEVDEDIPIYSSTWHHRPEWDGYLDIWGIGHYGLVSPEKMEELKRAGDRLWFTTDGQMCTDTPYCAVERLLPHYCFKYGVEAYEFWGVDWLTYDPHQFGWHRYIHQSGEPGKSTWVRYPNGDGFLAYPGKPLGYSGPLSSIRLEQAREGVEDYEYLTLLEECIRHSSSINADVKAARQVLSEATQLVDIPNAGGRYSTKILDDPDAILKLKWSIGEAIETLQTERKVP